MSSETSSPTQASTPSRTQGFVLWQPPFNDYFEYINDLLYKLRNNVMYLGRRVEKLQECFEERFSKNGKENKL